MNFLKRNFGYFSGAAVLTLAIASLQNAASAASSWSQQPSWASSSSSVSEAPARRPSNRNRDTSPNVAPFAPGSNNIAVDVGQVLLMGDLGTNYSSSIGTQIHYTYGVSDMFGFDTSIGYSNHQDDASVKSFSMATLLAGLRTNLTWYDKVIPHAVFGLGFYRPNFTTADYSVSPVLFGVHLGPGIDLQLTKQLFFGASLTFHDVFGSTKITRDGRLDTGGTYTSLFLRAGFTF